MRNTTRHDAILNKNTCDIPVHVVGVGGVGSEIVRSLAKLGVGLRSEFHLYDGDVVEAHNLPNQAYHELDVGQKKVTALLPHILSWGGIELGKNVRAHPHYVGERVPFAGIVFLALDSMGARRDICEQSLWENADVGLVIETRIDTSFIIVHALDPNNSAHTKRWTDTWYSDDEREDDGGCGTHLAINPTVSIAANHAVWLFIRAVAVHHGTEDYIPNKLVIDLRALTMRTEYWDEAPTA